MENEVIRRLGNTLDLSMRAIMKRAGFKSGDVVKIVIKDGEVLIKKVEILEK